MLATIQKPRNLVADLQVLISVMVDGDGRSVSVSCSSSWYTKANTYGIWLEGRIQGDRQLKEFLS